MITITGTALYQNHGVDQTGIQISIFDVGENLIGVTQTGADGQFVLTVPQQDIYHWVIEASLHQRIQFLLAAGQALPDIIMAGGDLDADGCIGQLDLDLFMSLFATEEINRVDITGDGLVDAADFAILAGNYDSTCASFDLIPTFTPSPTLSSTLVESATPDASTPTQESTLIETPFLPEITPPAAIDPTAALITSE